MGARGRDSPTGKKILSYYAVCPIPWGLFTTQGLQRMKPSPLHPWPCQVAFTFKIPLRWSRALSFLPAPHISQCALNLKSWVRMDRCFQASTSHRTFERWLYLPPFPYLVFLEQRWLLSSVSAQAEQINWRRPQREHAKTLCFLGVLGFPLTEDESEKDREQKALQGRGTGAFPSGTTHGLNVRRSSVSPGLREPLGWGICRAGCLLSWSSLGIQGGLEGTESFSFEIHW